MSTCVNMEYSSTPAYIIYEFKPRDSTMLFVTELWREALDEAGLNNVPLPEIIPSLVDWVVCFNYETLDDKRYELDEALWQKVENGDLCYLLITEYCQHYENSDIHG